MPGVFSRSRLRFAGRNIIGDAVTGPSPHAPTINRSPPFRPRFTAQAAPGPRLKNWGGSDDDRPGANPACRRQQQSVPLVPRFVELPFPTRGSTEGPPHARQFFICSPNAASCTSPVFFTAVSRRHVKRSNRGAQSKFGTYSAEIPRSIRPACRSKTMISDQEFGLS
jgi:hypothetical protein